MVNCWERKHCRYFRRHSKVGPEMMVGEPHPVNLTVCIPPPLLQDDPNLLTLAEMESPLSSPSAFPVVDFSSYSLQYPCIDLDYVVMENEPGADFDVELSDGPVDSFSSDHFRMFHFKVKKCARGSSHDWTQCPYAHPGEKARRRDLRKYHYSGTTCPEFRKGICQRGDLCEFAHGVFESWLHPARYRTQPCKDGKSCRRLVCFFAHSPQQLRVLPEQNSISSTDGSPAIEASFVSSFPFLTSPISVSPLATPIESPPLSPMSRSLGSTPIKEMTSSLRSLQLCKATSLPSSRKVQVGSAVFGSPTRNGYFSLPTTPTRIRTFSGIRRLDSWEEHFEEEPVMERVESGKDLRAKMYEKLKKENSLDRIDPSPSSDPEFYRVTKSIIS